jgi:hypothetical protein
VDETGSGSHAVTDCRTEGVESPGFDVRALVMIGSVSDAAYRDSQVANDGTARQQDTNQKHSCTFPNKYRIIHKWPIRPSAARPYSQHIYVINSS